jgi:DNA helicase-2/ATP-dependent DNA helicase PcrA
LRKLNIPYKVYGGLSFYQRKEIKDLLAYFRLAANPNDEEALKRVINYPKRAIGKTSIEKLIVAANNYTTSIWEVICDFHKYPVDINNGTKSRISEFATMIKSFQSEINTKDAFSLAERIARSSGIMKELIDAKDKGPEEVERFQNVEELLSGIQEFSNSGDEDNPNTLADFMLEVALLTDADQDKPEEKNHVSLMTIHSSKGLEFPNVYLVGMEENLFPSQMSLHSRSDLEEERRLFYVAVTRAMESCTLSYAVSRFLWGQSISCEPSRFIDEIDPNYLEFSSKSKSINRGLSMKGFEGGRTGGLNKMTNPSLRSLKEVTRQKSSSPNEQDIKVGYNVEHKTFGKGKVTHMEGSGADQKATIFFPHHGSKTILLRFANLEILNEE